MKKSTKKIVNYLKRYIGHPIIRTTPTTFNNDWSYTSEPILLTGFTQDGRIKYRPLGLELRIFGNKEKTLMLHFTDRNWITLKKASRAKQNRLNEWRGMKIYRIHPTKPRTLDSLCEENISRRIRHGKFVTTNFTDVPRGDSSFTLKFITHSDAPILLSASKHHIILSGHTKDTVRILSKDYAIPEDWALYDA